MQTQELYQLALFIQEASMREEILRQKITSLQTFIDQAKETSENGWLVSLEFQTLNLQTSKLIFYNLFKDSN